MSQAPVNTASGDQNRVGSIKGSRALEELRNHSNGRLSTESVRDGRVLVLYTGGTIGMVRNENGGIIIY